MTLYLPQECYAKMIEDSINEAGHRVSTLECRFHRFVLAEFNTHRVFSRNSASSRAIPVGKQIKRVEMTPALPFSWPAEQPGMQGGAELEDATAAIKAWRNAADDAVINARRLVAEGVHKSVTNRVLEPFMWHTVIVTSTAWENFFGLRCNPMAQPEIRVAAEAMKEAYDASLPRPVASGDWHLPYVSDEERETLSIRTCVSISAARCARVSYLTQDGVRDVDKDLELYNRLTSASPMHASPLEHVATPDISNIHTVKIRSEFEQMVDPMELELPNYGNLLGWHQHRFDVEAEIDYKAFA